MLLCKKASKSEHVFLRDNTGNIGGLDDDLPLGSNTDIRSPDGITNHDPFRAAPDSTHDNARSNLVEDKNESNVLEQKDNVHPPLERQVLLLYLIPLVVCVLSAWVDCLVTKSLSSSSCVLSYEEIDIVITLLNYIREWMDIGESCKATSVSVVPTDI